MRNLALMWVLAGVVGLAFGGGDTSIVPTFTDERDGKVYKIVKIGRQTWFAENLNYAAEGSVCYKNKNANCAKYGRLYNWETALTACPAGTHLPTYWEWTTLVDYAGGDSTAGTKLKSSRGWKRFKGVPVGTNDYGFLALPGGVCFRNGFYCVGYCGYWWSASDLYGCGSWGDTTENCAWRRRMNHNYEDVESAYDDKTDLFSVRCVLYDEKEKRK